MAGRKIFCAPGEFPKKCNALNAILIQLRSEIRPEKESREFPWVRLKRKCFSAVFAALVCGGGVAQSASGEGGSLYPDEKFPSIKLVAADELDRLTAAEPKTEPKIAPASSSAASRAPSPSLSPKPAAPARGSLYSSALQRVEKGALGAALGSAAYVLRDAGTSDEFRAEIRRAVGRHPSFHAQTALRAQSRAGQRRERAALYPQLSTQFRGDYSVSRSFDAGTDNVVESLRPREQFTAGVSASQLIFDGGATFQRIKSARARDEENKNTLSSRINDLSLGALASYHDLLTGQALLGMGEAFIRRHEKILGDVKERKRLGAGSQADVTRTVARLAAAQARVAGIREAERLAQIRYLEFFKGEPGVLLRPSFERVAVQTRQQAMASATSSHPEIAAANARAEASRADFKAVKGSRYPEIRLSVDATKFDVFDSGDDFDIRAGVNLNYAIFDGGARGANIASARARAEQEKFSTEQIRQDIERAAAIAFEQREGADNRLEALGIAVVAHDKTRELVLERYRVARGDLIDVLQAENDYFEAGAAYLSGLASRDMAVYGLMEHTGDLLRYFSPQPEYNELEAGGAYVE